MSVFGKLERTAGKQLPLRFVQTSESLLRENLQGSRFIEGDPGIEKVSVANHHRLHSTLGPEIHPSDTVMVPRIRSFLSSN